MLGWNCQLMFWPGKNRRKRNVKITKVTRTDAWFKGRDHFMVVQPQMEYDSLTKRQCIKMSHNSRNFPCFLKICSKTKNEEMQLWVTILQQYFVLEKWKPHNLWTIVADWDNISHVATHTHSAEFFEHSTKLLIFS